MGIQLEISGKGLNVFHSIMQQFETFICTLILQHFSYMLEYALVMDDTLCIH